MIAVLGGGAYAVWRRADPATPVSAAPRLVRPERRSVETTIDATGSIQLRVGAEVRVGSQVSGIVKTLNVTVGSHIRKGAVIAEIDARTLEAQRAQAQAQVDMAQVSVEKAALDFKRNSMLAARQIVPRQTFDDSRLAVDAAQAALEKARRDLAAVDVSLSYVNIRAPISGTIASVSTQEGETVAAAFTAPTFVTIIADHALELVAMVDETDIGGVRIGDPVTFTTEAYPDLELTGTVSQIAPAATIVSGVVNYAVSIAISGSQSRLKPQMTANVVIRTAHHEGLVVPSDAVHRNGDERFVYVEAGGTLRKQPVIAGGQLGGTVEIKQGLGASDRVAVPTPGARPGG